MNDVSHIKRAAVIRSGIISFFYVGFGTLTALSVYPPHYGAWVDIGMLLTFPVCILSVGIMYADSQAYGLVVVVQLAHVSLMWYILYKYLVGKYSRRLGQTKK